MIKIITDSASDFSQAQAKEMGITIIPLSTYFGDEEYLDGVTMSHKEFFTKLTTSGIYPTTSQINPVKYEEEFKKVTSNGDSVLCITLSSKLSGCYQSAMIAKEEVEGDIHVVDSLSVTLGEQLVIRLALKLISEGKGIEEIVQTLEEKKKEIKLYAVLDTLEYLKKGGRISKTVAFVGGILSLKPIISVEAGEVKFLDKARGNHNANAKLNNYVKNSRGIDYSFPFSLAYSGLTDELLVKYREDSKDVVENIDEAPVASIGSTIGTHVGPGAIAIAYFEKR